MAKKEEKPENPENPENPEKIEKIEEKVEKKVEAVEKVVEKKTGKRQNLIGEELANPEVSEDFDYAKWAKSVDERLDKLLGNLPEKKADDTSPPPAPAPEQPWYEKELF